MSAAFLGAYHFDGAADVLLAAYERLTLRFPADDADLRVCLVRDGGITVLDACPSRAVFEDFIANADVRTALATAGLPVPRVEPLGDVHAAHIGESVR